MASTPLSSLILLTLPSLFLLLSPLALAQTTAPAPASAGPVNLTGILDKNGQFTTFIRLLTETQVANQVENQLNNSQDGMTVFAPTDNAFNNLPAGTINGLDNQKKVQLVLYHILPKFYSLSDLQLVSNPVRTQATGQNGGVFGLNFTGQNNQINVSTGVVTTQINNALSQTKPLAVYQVDKVLLPEELFGTNKTTAEAPPSPPSSAKAPSSATNTTAEQPAGSDSSGKSMGLGLVVGLALVCMGFLS